MSGASNNFVHTGFVSPDNLLESMGKWLNPELWKNGNIPIPPNEAIDLSDINMRLHFAFTEKFCFFVPCREVITTIQEYLLQYKRSALLSVGSGKGYAEELFALAGIETAATDINPRHKWIEKLSAAEAIEKYPDRAVFISWPVYETVRQTIDTMLKLGLDNPIFLAQDDSDVEEICIGRIPLTDSCGPAEYEVHLPCHAPQIFFGTHGTARLYVFGPPKGLDLG